MADERWLTGPVAGIGIASFFSDAGHEIPTSLLPRFVTTTLSASPAALGLIEGVADGVAGVARLLGGGLADDPELRRRVAVGGYTSTAVLSSAIGVASSPLQVGALRAGAWAGRGVRGPSRNALLAELAPPAAYGRAFGFERAMDNFGAIVGPLLAVVLVEWIGVRHAIEVSVIPGLLAAVAIFYAARRASAEPAEQAKARPRLQLAPVLKGELGRLLVAAAAFELGNVAATLFILRATGLLQPGRGLDRATSLAVGLYVLYNAAAALGSIPAGRVADRVGNKAVLVAGPVLFIAAYTVFGVGPGSIAPLAVGFVLAGTAVACSETAQSAAVAAVAPDGIRGSAFGVLATVQSVGNLVASGLVGLLWASGNIGLAFAYADACMVLAVVLLLTLIRGALRAEVG
jgi:MFS family permease